MKNQLVAPLVAAILMFLWQFLSWTMLNVHGKEHQYTDKQDAIMEFLGQQQLPTGSYMMPQPSPESTPEEQQAFYESGMGKPWAMVEYHASTDMSMTMNMIRGFLVDLAAAFLLVWLLSNFANLTFGRAILASWAVGAAAYLTIPYLNSIWYERNTVGYIVDVVVQWGMVGVWLGWYMRRR